MSSRVAYTTSIGLVGERNEDSAYIGRRLCAVADGMGGHAAGDIASGTVIDAIRRFDVAAENPGQIIAILGNAIREANSRLTAKVQAEPRLGSIGSTLTAMSWSESHVVVANIGDLRAYRPRPGVLNRLTEDHVMSKLVASPMLSEISEYLVRYLDGRPGWSPDLTPHKARPGDRYLICSYGLSAVLSEDMILQDILAGQESASRLLHHLQFGGGRLQYGHGHRRCSFWWRGL